MKPGSGDIKVGILITGLELKELQRHTGMMAESFGLDRRIEYYQGMRPIGLYRWDIECLEDVIESALRDDEDYPSKTSEGYRALAKLQKRLKRIYDKNFKDLFAVKQLKPKTKRQRKAI
jgi:hypothetical protein